MTTIKFKNGDNWEHIALSCYPVGSVYMSENSTSPATIFGGTWVALEDRMLIGAGTVHTVGDTGGAETVTLTKEQSGLPAHGHGFTQPTVNGGAVTKGISDGSHKHNYLGMPYANVENRSGGDTYNPYNGYAKFVTHTSESSTHTHNLPAHTHSVSGGAVSDNSGANAAQAHDNMPPYLAIYMWKRTA